jgi:flagellin-like protein
MKGMSPLIAAILLIVFTIAVATLLSLWVTNCVMKDSRILDFCNLKYENCTKIQCDKAAGCNIECGFNTSSGIKIMQCDFFKCWERG